MTKDYLLEIGLEDMPAHVVTPSLDQLVTKTQAFLKDQRLSFDHIERFATPRRLAILVHGLADKQVDTEEDIKGPAKKIAQDESGKWTKAAIGFTRGQGMTVDDIEFRDLKGTEYVFLHKAVKGLAAETILPGLIEVIKGLTFPTRMKWGNYDFEYIRPIHWLVSLLDDAIVPMTLLDVHADRVTMGHRFLGRSISLSHADDYIAALAAQYVLVDPAKRKQAIVDQIKAIEASQHWQIDLDADLLEEVSNLVEYPTAFAGRFDEKYLAIPEAVLITSMKDNQRYFYARDQAGQMVNAFIGVRNGTADYLDNVIAGNEKVLTARLEDAAFFYAEDQKRTINAYVLRLKEVTFHDKIGSVAAKMARTKTIAAFLADRFGLSVAEKQDLARAASIYKFDLVTAMVGEFPELQGTMAAEYARLAGESAGVIAALAEQYMPISSDGELPQTTVGSVLALADKFDALMSFFAVGLIPSGSNDPYALRRQAYGIVRIIEAHDWQFPVATLQGELAQVLADAGQQDGLDFLANREALDAFMIDRVKQRLQADHIRHDIIDAVAANTQANISGMLDAARLLSAHQSDPDFKAMIEALGRVVRIAAPQAELHVDPQLFDNPSEAALEEAIANVEANYTPTPSEANYQALRALTQPIDDYFELTMVMAKDPAVKVNRLALLWRLAQLIQQFGDLTQIIAK